MQICTSPQTDNHASTQPLIFYSPTDSVKALKALNTKQLISGTFFKANLLASTDKKVKNQEKQNTKPSLT